MKKFVFFLLTIFCLSSCLNTKPGTTTDGIDSVAKPKEFEQEFKYPGVNVAPKNTEITFNFSSYHLYTCEDDKYDASGYQQVAAIVTIDEESGKASLKLYDSGDDQWFVFNFRIDEKMNLQEGVITYSIYNNVNQKAYIYVSTNRPNGLFIDINNFEYEGDAICCWMQEGDSSGAEYRSNSVTINSTPNTTPSNSSYNSDLSRGSIHSNESVYGDFYNYEETDNCVEGVVVYEGTGDYYIIETRKGYTVLERYSGRLDEGDKVRGELNKYNFTYLINRNKRSEVRVYIEDYMLSDDNALEWLGEHDHLKYDHQRAYDANND